MPRRIYARIAVVATRGRFFPDSVQVFAKVPVPGEHLRHPVSQGGGVRPRPTKCPSLEGQPRRPLAPARPPLCRGWHAICWAGPVEPNPQRRRSPDRPHPTDPECGGKFRGTSVPAVRTWGTWRAPPLLPPKWCGSPSLPWWPPSCATSWLSGDCGGWPSGPLPRSELHRGASIALRCRAHLAEAANALMRSPSLRPMVPGARSERGRSSDCPGSGPGISCWFRSRSQPPPTSGDNPLEASHDRPCGRTTLPQTSQGTPSTPIPWSRRPRGHSQFRQTNGSVPRRAPDKHQRIVGIARQRRVRRHRHSKHRVVRNVP